MCERFAAAGALQQKRSGYKGGRRRASTRHIESSTLAMAHKMLLSFAAVLLAVTTSQGRTLRATVETTSAQAQLGAAASAGAGGDSSEQLKETVAQFYLQVQQLKQTISDANVAGSEEGQKQLLAFKEQLDILENQWRSGNWETLPAQLQKVSDQEEIFANFVQQQADSQEGDAKAKSEALVTALKQLGTAAQALKGVASAEQKLKALQQQAQTALHQGEAAFAQLQNLGAGAAQLPLQVAQAVGEQGMQAAEAAVKNMIAIKKAEIDLATSLAQQGVGAATAMAQQGVGAAAAMAQQGEALAKAAMEQKAALAKAGAQQLASGAQQALGAGTAVAQQMASGAQQALGAGTAVAQQMADAASTAQQIGGKILSSITGLGSLAGALGGGLGGGAAGAGGAAAGAAAGAAGGAAGAIGGGTGGGIGGGIGFPLFRFGR